MPTYLLVELKDDGTAEVTALTDPATVTQAIEVPLASLLPAPPAVDAPTLVVA